MLVEERKSNSAKFALPIDFTGNAKIPYTYNHTPNRRHMSPAFCRDGP